MFDDGTIINELFIERLNYIIYVILLLIGLHGMIAKNNLIKKLIGMSIFQTAIILFYVSVGVKEGATIPIYLPEHDPHGSHAHHEDGNSTDQSGHGPVVLEAGLVKGYANPLPHVLMLTAIVVGVATLGLALALCLKIYQGYGTIEEDELLAKIEQQEMRSKPGSQSVTKPKSASSKKIISTKPKSTGNTVKSKSKPVAKEKAVKSTSTTTSKTKAKSTAQPKKTASGTKTGAAKPKPKSAVRKKAAKPDTKTTTQKKKASTAKKPTSQSKKAPPKK